MLFGPTDILAERGDIGGEMIASVLTPKVRRRVMARLSPCSAALVNHWIASRSSLMVPIPTSVKYLLKGLA